VQAIRRQPNPAIRAPDGAPVHCERHRAGQKVLTLQGPMPRDAAFKQSLCADIQGNSAACRIALRRR